MIDALDAMLSRVGIVAGWELHETISSTNDLAFTRAQDPQLKLPHLVWAHEQTAGRGRSGNRWWSPPGALMFSLIWEVPLPLVADGRWVSVSLAAAVAVCQAVELAVPGLRCNIRWPNDVFVGDKKLCGILPEFCKLGPRLVLGIGINVENSLAGAPDDVRARAISLADHASCRPNRVELLEAVLAELLVTLPRSNEDWPTLAQKWQGRCGLTHRKVALKLPASRHQGLCLGMDETGGLLIDTAAGVSRHYSGTLEWVE